MNWRDWFKNFTTDIGIDLGTANTLVYVKGHGIVLNEPSVVALNHKTGSVVAVGSEAKQMVGRTPTHIAAVRPLEGGVISNFEAAEEMLHYFVRLALSRTGTKAFRSRVVIGVPSGITNVERRAVRDAAYNAGAREVYLAEQAMLAAIGVQLPVADPAGTMVIDIGGGTTDIAIISLGGIVKSKSFHIAGDKLDRDITGYIRDEFKILLGDKTAEETKIAIGSVFKQPAPLEAPIKGRDLVSGLPREVVITDADIRDAILPSITSLIDSIKEVLETTPPEILGDIMTRGIVLVGGGALIHGLPELLARELKIPIYIADDPLTAVVRGTGVVLEALDVHRDIFIDDEQTLPPQS